MDKGILVFLFCFYHSTCGFVECFSILLQRQRSHRPSLALHAEGARAGADGYSLLRQPVNWDLDRDPVFEAPKTLTDDSETPQMMDMDWISARGTVQKQTTSPTKAKEEPSTTHRQQNDGQVDLFQRTLDTLDFPRVLQALSEECTTIPARILVQEASRTTHRSNEKQKDTTNDQGVNNSDRTMLMSNTAVGCQERYGAVKELEWILESSHGTAKAVYENRLGYQEEIGGRSFPFLGKNSFPLQPLLETGDQVLEGDEVRLVSDMMDSMEDTQLWASAIEDIGDFVYLPVLASSIVVNTTLQELLHGAFDKDGRLDGSTFPTIGRLRALVRSLKSSVLDTLNELIPKLQPKMAVESGGPLYSEISGGRLVIPVAPKYASSIGIVHDRSRSGKTVYVEPQEILAPTNDLRQTESELQAEESRIWRYLTEQILHNKASLEQSVAAIGQLDLVSARYSLGRKLFGIIPEVQDEGVIRLENVKHPVLILRDVPEVVGSDISFGEGINQGLVLTGPNAGGKTVILKLLGLVALMARSGIPIPADASNKDAVVPRVDFFRPVLADIGDIQSVGGDLSTFSGHMLVCREVLENAGKNALVLMDEISSGTDPNQGVAIAQALLEAVVDTGARVAITTHYMQLKQLAASDGRFAVAGMQFVNSRPTYKLQQGIVGESFALSVAERLGLPSSVIERANALLDSETRQMGDLIRDMEDQKALVDKEAAELQQMKAEMQKAELKMQEDLMRLERKQLDARRKEAKKFAAVLEEKEQLLEDVLEKLKKDPSRKVVAKSWDDIKMVRRDALEEAENVPSTIARKKEEAAEVEKVSQELVPLSDLPTKPELKEGDTLIVRQKGPFFGTEATVIRGSKNRVNVQIGNVSANLKFSEVALPTATTVKKNRKSRISDRFGRSKISKATMRALEAEAGTVVASSPPKQKVGELSMRTPSNTVDVRGSTLMDAQEKIGNKFSACLSSNQSVLYILHGHGTGGVLKSKIRAWLNSSKSVKTHEPAAVSDGGDAFTRVTLR